MADSGHIDFEVAIPQKQPLIIYQTKPARRRSVSLLAILLTCFVTGVVVWSVLTVAFSIEDSCDKITYELQREHKEEMRRLSYQNIAFYK
jgi:hypothetical protein